MTKLKLNCGCCKIKTDYYIENGLYVCSICGAKNIIGKIEKCEHLKEDIKKDVIKNIYDNVNYNKQDDKDYTLREWVNINYADYIDSIKEFINKYDYKELLGTNELDLNLGKLSEPQIAKLKVTLKNGFDNHESIRTIAENIKKNVNPGPIYRIDNDGKKVERVNEDNRSLVISKSETVRASQGGSVIEYEKNGVEQVRWLASYSDRTCSECEALNNQIFDIKDKPDYPHANCRCAIVSYP